MNKELIIVAGVSSAGKSTLIDQFILPALKADGINIDKDVEISFAGKLSQNFELGDKQVNIVHYNSLLQFDIDPLLEKIDLSSESVFNNLLNGPSPSQVYLCYAPDNILRNRIKSRTAIEPKIAPNENTYPSGRILNNFEKIDQRNLVLEFAEKFKSLTDNIHVAFSTDDGFTLISWDDFKFGIPNPSLEKAINPKPPI